MRNATTQVIHPGVMIIVDTTVWLKIQMSVVSQAELYDVISKNLEKVTNPKGEEKPSMYWDRCLLGPAQFYN